MSLRYLLDTNILLRLIKRNDPQQVLIRDAIDQLLEGSATLCYCSQNVIELWNVLTRPEKKNGFGLTISAADQQTKLIEAQFDFLPDTENIYRRWRELVVQYGASGRQVHDARLVAVMLIHNVSQVLTLNITDFERYAGKITAVHPEDIVRKEV